MSLTVFENCVLIDGRSDEPREGMTVVVEDNRIKEVGERAASFTDARVVDVGGRTLMPGLIDAHVHVYAACLDYRRAADMPLTLMTVYAVHRLRAMLDRGFTTVRDVAGGDFGIKEAVAQGLIPGPRLFIAGRAISMTGGHGDTRGRTEHRMPCACASNANDAMCRVVDGVPEMRRAVRDELRKGADQIKLLVSGGVGSPFDPLESRQFSEEEVLAAVDEAGAWDRYVCAHSYSPRSTQLAVRCGVRCIEHGNLIDRETAQLMAENDVFMVPTLVCYEEAERRGQEFNIPPAILPKLRKVTEAGIGMLEICREAGVAMGFGTDLMGELQDAQSREFSIRAEVCPAMEIIRSATSVNASILQRDGELGEIAAGALADLLVVDGNPLDDLQLLQDQGQHLVAIMKDGVFYKYGLN